MVGAVKRATNQTKIKTKNKQTRLSNKQANFNSVKETKKPVISGTFKFLLTCLFNITYWQLQLLNLLRIVFLFLKQKGKLKLLSALHWGEKQQRKGRYIKSLGPSKEKEDQEDQVKEKDCDQEISSQVFRQRISHHPIIQGHLQIQELMQATNILSRQKIYNIYSLGAQYYCLAHPTQFQ